MKLTKFQHACLVLEQGHETIVIDPGVFTHDFIMPRHVLAIVVTHNHPDHCDPTLVERIHKTFPKAVLVAHESITSQFPTIPSEPVVAGETRQAGSFSLRFFGGEHAPISPGIEVPPNLGILVNEQLYYPGDSFFAPQLEVQLEALALPVSAPWLTIDHVFSFLTKTRPALAFPTHDAILSADGQALVDRMVGGIANAEGIIYKRLNDQQVEL